MATNPKPSAPPPPTLENLRAAIAGKQARINSLEQSATEQAAEKTKIESALPELRAAVHARGEQDRATELRLANGRLQTAADAIQGYTYQAATERAELAGLVAQLGTAQQLEWRNEQYRLNMALAHAADAMVTGMQTLAPHIGALVKAWEALNDLSERRGQKREPREHIERMLRNLLAGQLHEYGVDLNDLVYVSHAGVALTRAELDRLRTPAAPALALTD